MASTPGGGRQPQVPRPDQPRPADLEEPVSEHVRAQQHLAFAPLEPVQVQRRAGDLDGPTGEIADLPGRDEDLAPAYAGD